MAGVAPSVSFRLGMCPANLRQVLPHEQQQKQALVTAFRWPNTERFSDVVLSEALHFFEPVLLHASDEPSAERHQVSSNFGAPQARASSSSSSSSRGAGKVSGLPSWGTLLMLGSFAVTALAIAPK